MTANNGARIAIYPGSFDPITNGHLDVISRAVKIADHLIVAVLRNETKQPLFSVAERVAMLRQVVTRFNHIEIDSFDGLLVDYAARRGATLIVRGIRAISDYEGELQMALMNRRLRPEVETIFLMAGEQYSFVSSRLVKEVIRLGGDIRGLVPPVVENQLKNRLAERSSSPERR
jgi:pantetheine-phosphate adenylyltransferase